MDNISVREIAKTIANTDQCSSKYILLTKTLRELITSRLEQLGQLIQDGPIYDGDIISKSQRDDLIEWGLASKACCKGRQGFTVATYIGWDVYHANVH